MRFELELVYLDYGESWDEHDYVDTLTEALLKAEEYFEKDVSDKLEIIFIRLYEWRDGWTCRKSLTDDCIMVRA